MPKEGRGKRVGGALGSLTAGAAGGAAMGALFGPAAPFFVPVFAALGAGLGTTAFLLSGVSEDEQQDIIEGARDIETYKKKKVLSKKEIKHKNKLLKKFPILRKDSALIARNAPNITPEVKKEMANLNAELKKHPEIEKNVNDVRNDIVQGKESLTPLARAFSEGGITDESGRPKGNAWEGYPAQQLRFQKFSPEQIAAQNQVRNMALEGLGKNQFDFAPIEQQAREGFAQKTIPGIAERFSQLGAQRSSAFPQLLSQSGKDLETELAAMKQNYGLTQQQALQNLLGIGLTPQFGSVFYAGQPGMRSNLLNKAADFITPELIGQGLGAFKSGAGKAGEWIYNKFNKPGDQDGSLEGSMGADSGFTPSAPFGANPIQDSLKLLSPGQSATTMANSPLGASPNFKSGYMDTMKALYPNAKL